MHSRRHQCHHLPCKLCAYPRRQRPLRGRLGELFCMGFFPAKRTPYLSSNPQCQSSRDIRAHIPLYPLSRISKTSRTKQGATAARVKVHLWISAGVTLDESSSLLSPTSRLSFELAGAWLPDGPASPTRRRFDGDSRIDEVEREMLLLDCTTVEVALMLWGLGCSCSFRLRAVVVLGGSTLP